MWKPGKRKWVQLLCVTNLLALTAACSSGGSSGEPTASAPAATTGASPAATAAATPEPPAKLRMFISDFSQKTPAADSSQITHMEKKSNTDLEIVYMPHGQYQEQLTLKFASGDFPDIYQHWEPPVPDLVSSGLILELNDLIDKYGPNLKKYIPKESWDSVTINGKILAVPEPPQTRTNRTLFVRKDWLDKLGLQPPKTSKEFMDMLIAFRDKDPNGNGKQDEIPYTMREKISWADSIFAMWGLSHQASTLHNNEVIWGNIHPNYKKAIDMMATMYKEKLLDSESMTNSRSVWEQKIKSDLVGSWTHVPELAAQWQQDLNKSLPGKAPVVLPIATPRGEGYDGELGSSVLTKNKTFIIFKSSKNPVAAIKYLDWLVSEEGQAYTELGVEGESFTKAGTKYTYLPEKDADGAWRTTALKLHGLNKDVLAAKQTDPAMFELMSKSFDVANAEGVLKVEVPLPKDKFNFDTLFQEAAAKIILGEAPIDSYDNFIQTWRKQGGDTLIKENTDFHNSTKK